MPIDFGGWKTAGWISAGGKQLGGFRRVDFGLGGFQMGGFWRVDFDQVDIGGWISAVSRWIEVDSATQ